MLCYKCHKNPVSKLTMCKDCKTKLFNILGRKTISGNEFRLIKTRRSSKGRRVIRKPILEDKYVRT